MNPTDPTYGVVPAAQGSPIAATSYPMSNMPQSTYSGNLPYSAPTFGYGPSIDTRGYEAKFAQGGSTGQPTDDEFLQYLLNYRGADLGFDKLVPLPARLPPNQMQQTGGLGSLPVQRDYSVYNNMPRTRVGFNPNEVYLRENAIRTGGIGPYMDALNSEFAAGPRYKTQVPTGFGWATPGGGGLGGSSFNSGSGGGGGGGGGGGTYGDGSTSGTNDDLSPVDTSGAVKKYVRPTPTGIETLVGGATTPVDDTPASTKEKKAELVLETPEGAPLIPRSAPTGTETLVGGATTPEKEREGKLSLEELVTEEGGYAPWETSLYNPPAGYKVAEAGGYAPWETNLYNPRGEVSLETITEDVPPTTSDTPADTNPVEYSPWMDAALRYSQGDPYSVYNPPARETSRSATLTAEALPQFETNFSGLDRSTNNDFDRMRVAAPDIISLATANINPNYGEVPIDYSNSTGFSNYEADLYGASPTAPIETGLSNWEQNLYGTAAQTQTPSDDYATQWGMSPQEIALYESAATQNQPTGAASTTTSGAKTGFFDWLTGKAKNAANDIVKNPIETLANVGGQALTGVPYLGTAGEKAIDYISGKLSDNGTGLTDAELALYGGGVDTSGDSATQYNNDDDIVRFNTITGPAPPSAGDTTFGPGQLSTGFRGTGDMNAINFLTGSSNISGSPTNMIGPSGEGSWYSAGIHGDTYAPGQTFASMNTELADYAKAHPVTAGYDPFKEDRDRYFASHPEMLAENQRAKTPQELEAAAEAQRKYYEQRDAANTAQTPQEYTPDQQQQLNDYYSQLYGDSPFAAGGLASLPEYKAGGLLDGPGDGMSDSIPAVIKGPRPQRAALADGEFVIPADVVSHLGNGSTKAGSAQLYAMMDRIRKARTGNPKQGKQIDPRKYLSI